MKTETPKEPSIAHHVTHYDRIVAVIVIVVLAVIVSWYGVSGRFAKLGEVSTIPQAGVSAGNTFEREEAKPALETFVVADTPVAGVGEAKQNITATDTKDLKAPENFKTFTYDAKAGKRIAISGNCHDKYYAFLIFNSTTDYRKNPSGAYANRATECPPSGVFTLQMDLRDINLESGSYYFFIADQGKTGTWYDPR